MFSCFVSHYTDTHLHVFSLVLIALNLPLIINKILQQQDDPSLEFTFPRHPKKTIPDTSIQDLDPRPPVDNVHVSVFPHEMTTITPGENPTRTLNQDISSVELMMIVSLFHFFRLGSDPSSPRCTT